MFNSAHDTTGSSRVSPSDADPQVVEMFNRISRTYDRLNRFFSVGIDRVWRRKAVRSLELERGMRVLDCSAGTGDMAFEAHRQCPGVHTTLLDPARHMLDLADVKAKRIGVETYATVCAAAEQMPFADGAFDRFMVSFGIRNFASLENGMSELARVTKPGGRGVVLEFTPDRSAVIDRVFRFYMWRVMRPVGGAVSRDRDAYAYLARTIQNFPATEKLVELFRECGFLEVHATPLSFGIATRFTLVK